MPEPSLRWSYSADANRYRDKTTGRFIKESAILGLRDSAADSYRQTSRALIQNVLDGKTGYAAWENGMRDLIRTAHINLYMLGRGGSGSLTTADVAKIVDRLNDQFTALRGFRNEIAGGTVTPAAFASRAELYLESSIGAFEAGHNQAFIAAGVETVLFVTAQDDLVCEECEPLDRELFAIAQAPELPIHVNCRCTLVRVDEAASEDQAA